MRLRQPRKPRLHTAMKRAEEMTTPTTTPGQSSPAANPASPRRCGRSPKTHTAPPKRCCDWTTFLYRRPRPTRSWFGCTPHPSTWATWSPSKASRSSPASPPGSASRPIGCPGPTSRAPSSPSATLPRICASGTRCSVGAQVRSRSTSALRRTTSCPSPRTSASSKLPRWESPPRPLFNSFEIEQCSERRC